ncbi:MAG TPA: DUF4249 family protein [Mariniphaga sp.]|nr:DUF4249 family protein [Mariniphaga sp.]
MTVDVDGAVYSAETIVQQSVDIDTISYSYYTGDSFFRPGYRFNVAFKDPPGKKNYYRIRVSKNGFLFVRQADLVVFDDTDLDGRLITVRLHNQYYLKKGAFVVIELLAIDRQAWEYFTSLNDILNAGPGSPAPANPVSSFSNGAMG